MARASTKKPSPAETVIHDTGIDPLASFLGGRDGWTRNDRGDYEHEERSVVVTIGAPGSEHRFSISIKGSKPVTFRTVTAVQCFVTTAGA